MDTIETQAADNEWAQVAAQAAALDSEISPVFSVNETETVNGEPEIETAELLAPVIQVTADMLAPNWVLTDDECGQLATVYGALLDKYIPDNPAAKYGLEISALMTTAMIFGTRRGIPMKRKELKTKTEKSLTDDVNETEKQVVDNQTVNSILMPKATNEAMAND